MNSENNGTTGDDSGYLKHQTQLEEKEDHILSNF